MDDRRCTRLTAKGAKCRGVLIAWPTDISSPQPLTCWTHATGAERTAAQAGRDRADASWDAPVYRLMSSDPACWSWPVSREHSALALASMTAEDESSAEDLAVQVLVAWQDGRCAICGEADRLVTDHDHATGLVRGKLCRPCNTNEGFRKGDRGHVYARYRKQSPVSILGVRLRYLDPFTGEYASPAPPHDSRKENPMRGIGL